MGNEVDFFGECCCVGTGTDSGVVTLAYRAGDTLLLLLEVTMALAEDELDGELFATAVWRRESEIG